MDPAALAIIQVSIMVAQLLYYQWHQQVSYLFQTLQTIIFAASMSWRARLMDRLRHQIHSNYILLGLEIVIMTIQEDLKWISLLHYNRQIKIIWLVREYQTFFRKKSKYLIISISPIISISIIMFHHTINVAVTVL